MTLVVGKVCYLSTPSGNKLISGKLQKAILLVLLASPQDAQNAKSIEETLDELGSHPVKREIAKALVTLREKGLLTADLGDSTLVSLKPDLELRGKAEFLHRSFLSYKGGKTSADLDQLVAAANITLASGRIGRERAEDAHETVTQRCWSKAAEDVAAELKRPMLLKDVSVEKVYVPLLALSHVAGFPPSATLMMENGEPASEILSRWMHSADGSPVMYVLGGPGSGKSTELKVIATKVASEPNNRVLFLPLSRLRLDEGKGLVSCLREYLDTFVGPVENPLVDPLPEFRYLVILDGLDELALRGPEGVARAQAIADQMTNSIPVEVEGVRGRVKVIVSSRTLMFETLHINPEQQCISLRKLYYKMDERLRNLPIAHRYEDQADQRKEMWRKLAAATAYKELELPEFCFRPSIQELTDSPLSLHLLFAAFIDHGDVLSFWSRASLFRHYLQGVYHRKYEPHRSTLNFEFEEFSMALQEAALCSWPRGGRVFPLREVLERCEREGKAELAQRVLTSEGSPGPGLILFYVGIASKEYRSEIALEFTLKPFSDFLIALRIVEALNRFCMAKEGEIEHAAATLDSVCSAGVLTPEIREFVKDLLREQASRALVESCTAELRKAQLALRGQSTGPRVVDSRSLVILWLVLSTSKPFVRDVDIEWVDDTAAAILFQACSNGGNDEWSDPIRGCLEYLSFDGQDLRGVSFYGCRMSHSTFRACHAGAMEAADLNFCLFEKGHFEGANFSSTSLMKADLSGGYFTNASFFEAQLNSSSLVGAWCTGADFRSAILDYADLRGALLASSRIEGAGFHLAIVADAGGREVDLTFAVADSSILSVPVRVQLEEHTFRETTLRDLGWSLIEGRLIKPGSP